MAKRNWHESNLPSPPVFAQHGTHHSSVASPAQSMPSDAQSASPKRLRASYDDMSQDQSPFKYAGKSHKAAASGAHADHHARMPAISRKVKACAACRKQKIKCIMTGDPPCQRCKERGLSCRLNKSLQTLMSEDSRWKSFVTKDISTMYASLEQVLQSLSLPPLPAPQSSMQEPAIYFDQDDQGNDPEDEDQSYDNSPKVTPVTESLSHVPIESLYQITGLRSLRAQEGVTEDQNRICKQLRDTDFISRGLVKLDDAEYLARFYLNKLDPYIWHLGGDYKDLESFRRRSPTLTACVLTVAALHDSVKTALYPVCSKEFRRLVANAMFERRIDMEYLRALVIGSYWLSDVSWTLSGYAIRRASEFQLRHCYQQIAESVRDPTKYTREQLQNAMDGIRMLYLLYIVDHHLAILYGRSSIMRDNENYITGWETYLACSLATDSDKRIASQISLSFLMNSIREALGPEDTTSVLPASAGPKIAEFERALDDWVSRFSQHNPSKYVGNWPTKGVIMYYHFAKLYLDSYVLRGLPEVGATIPEYFLETASSAVGAATSIITLLLEDRDLQMALARVPHYFHGMLAFACMFLLKVATKHSEQLFVEIVRFRMLIGGLGQQLKGTEVGKEHLIHRMAEGMEKMAEMLNEKFRQRPQLKREAGVFQTAPYNGIGLAASNQGVNGSHSMHEPDPIDPAAFDYGDSALGLLLPSFDFDTLGMGEPAFPFTP